MECLSNICTHTSVHVYTGCAADNTANDFSTYWLFYLKIAFSLDLRSTAIYLKRSYINIRNRTDSHSCEMVAMSLHLMFDVVDVEWRSSLHYLLMEWSCNVWCKYVLLHVMLLGFIVTLKVFIVSYHFQ